MGIFQIRQKTDPYLEEVANNMHNYRGNDQYDNAWYSKILEDGRQVWIQIRDGIISVSYTHLTLPTK